MWGVLSDSHDDLLALKKALDTLKEEGAELILHAGDYVAPFSVRLLTELSIPWWGVLGNNDGEILGIFQKSEGKIKGPFLELEVKRIPYLGIPLLPAGQVGLYEWAF